jgi:hypothetical protein
MAYARLLAFVLLLTLCGLQWRALQQMRAEISSLRFHSVTEASRYAASQFSDQRRDELRRILDWLDSFYRSSEGLGRVGGVCADNRLDHAAIEQLMDPYLRARTSGYSEEQARQKIVDIIRQTDEWHRKHP